MNASRRKFLKDSAFTLAGTSLLPKLLFEENKKKGAGGDPAIFSKG